MSRVAPKVVAPPAGQSARVGPLVMAGRLAAVAALAWFGWVTAASIRTVLAGPRPPRTVRTELPSRLPEPSSLLGGGVWMLADCPWTLSFETSPARPLFDAPAANGNLAAAPFEGEPDLIATARERAGRVAHAGDRTLYAVEGDDRAFGLVVRTVGGRERVEEGWAAFASGEAGWQVLRLRPAASGESAGATHGGPNLLPWPPGTATVARKFGAGGRVVAEVVTADGGPAAAAAAWAREGWSVVGGRPGDVGPLVCRRGAETRLVWAAPRAGTGRPAVVAVLRVGD